MSRGLLAWYVWMIDKMVLLSASVRFLNRRRNRCPSGAAFPCNPWFKLHVFLESRVIERRTLCAMEVRMGVSGAGGASGEVPSWLFHFVVNDSNESKY